MLEWFLFKVNARSEYRITALCRQLDLRTFLPVVTKAQSASAPTLLFPGYLFIRVDPYSPRWRQVQHLDGVQALVRTAGEIRPVELSVILSLKRRLKPKATKVLQIPEPGQSIQLNYFGFEQIDAIFEEPCANERCRILINILGGERSLTVPIQAVV